MRYQRFIAVSLLVLAHCTYDASPPDASEIDDLKPLLLIDATGLPARRSVRIQYTDLSGTKTLATAAEKTDADGRILYPLFMTRGTRNYSVTLTYDETNDGLFDAGDKATTAITGAFSSDGETVLLRLSVADFSLAL
jgi:5-hydroxyisourate hydrolase-like protein (transthyretin family)